MTDETRPIATPSQTVGPFFHFGLATDATLGDVARDEARGERIRLRVTVQDGEGSPVPDALIELYQADADGRYRAAPFTGFGRLPTAADGTCVFETIRPGPVGDGRGATQAPHVNVCLLARGLLRHLYTRVYFAGDAGQDADPVLALVPPDRRRTLMATCLDDDQTTPGGARALASPPVWAIVIRLQGDEETVFFDL